MSIILILFLIILMFILLAFNVKAKITFHSNINDAEMSASLFWLGSFLRADLTYENSQSELRAYIFNKSIYESGMQSRESKINKHKLNLVEFIRSLYLSEVDIKTSYGFDNPFATGITCGLLGIVSQLVNIGSIEQNPDFTTADDFIYLNATANLNIGLTGINLIRAYARSSAAKPSYETGRGG